MASAGATWLQLLQAIQDDFQRLDLATTAPTLTAPLSTDPIWRYAQEAIEFFQPRMFLGNEGKSQWASTIVSNNGGGSWVGNLYSLPTDWEDDGQILINISGQNIPMTKRSEYEMNYLDIQGPPSQSPVTGPPAYYSVYQGQLRLFPWPDAVYPMTAVYTSLVAVPSDITTSNYWTTAGAAMIVHQACGLIRKHVTREEDYQKDFEAATVEFNKLSGRIRQQEGKGRATAHYL